MLKTINEHPLIRLLEDKRSKFVIGLMSGTSMDGIDVALVKIDGFGLQTRVDLIAFDTVSYSKELKNKLLSIATARRESVDDICRLNVVVGEYFLDAIYHICQKSGTDIKSIDLVGTHGQTVRHLPEEAELFGKKVRSTLQIGDPAIISARTGIVTVGLFRNSDMALGGQGAPLVPYFDYLLFRSREKNRVVVNIGGIANITLLPKNCQPEEVVAFDSGPGNMVIDGLMRRLFQQEFDRNGETAADGNISVDLLEKLLAHSYFRKLPPKSTGREEFGEAFIEFVLGLAEKERLAAKDVIATATELTARTIKNSVELISASANAVDEVIVGGGGIYNKNLMKRLVKLFSTSSVLATDEVGISSDAKEAICFAVLANETVHGVPASLPSATGATRPSILGAIYLG
ncbi:MAG: anhydro-N-acetylmuramic acid kinase [Calditrichaeota bacterium]|nr:anhydro-N-acetylmuramic acid kinase [Calditrichota bacterium]